MNKHTGKISPQLRYWRKQVLLNTAEGLTCKGTARKRRPNNNLLQELLAARRERGLKAWNARVNRLRALGLTTRGTTRIYAVRRGDAMLLKWQVDDLAIALANIFHSLPKDVQARALELESALSVIRKQLA